MKGWRVWATIVGGVLADQALKAVMVQYSFTAGNGSLWRIQLFANPGGPFSAPVPGKVMIGVSLVLLAGLILAITRQLQPLVRIGLTLILSGGLSNLLDRVFRGRIIDFIEVGTLQFNSADCLIVAGALLVTFSFFKPSQ